MRAPRLTFERAAKLRRGLTLPEVVLWNALRGRRLFDLRFRRQHPIGPYILDFYCPAVRLAVEIDGVAHDTPAAADHDERRTAWLSEHGIQVLRFRAVDVLRDERLNDVLDTIVAAAAPPPPPPAVPLPRFAGEEPARGA